MSLVAKQLSSKGEFQRRQTSFHSEVSADGSSGFKAQAGRYHLYVSLACPWAHRTLIVRALKGLESAISVSVVHWLLGEGGWKFTSEYPDHLEGRSFLSELYFATQADYAGSYTVPVLWDKQTKKIVNNESSEIIRMFNTEFNEFCATPDQRKLHFYPENLRTEIDNLNSWIYPQINNGVYRAGFARAQEAYDAAYKDVFDGLDRVEGILSKQRYLLGNKLTEADIRLFTTLVRFDPVYHGHFKCNRQRIIEFPAIIGFLRELYQMPLIKETVDFHHIKHHYYESHTAYNPTGVVPNGPDLSYLEHPHGRERFVSSL